MQTTTEDIIGEHSSRSGWAYLEHEPTLIAGGRRFDIAKATKVAEQKNGDRSDFRYKRETLYRTPRGNWLLVVEGWIHRDGNGITPGHIPAAVTAAEARQWLEAHGEDRVLEEYFADEIEDA